jgi:hypothetical protein
MTSAIVALVLAAAPEILLPPWPLSADGELVAVRGDAPLAARGATVERVVPGVFRVVPEEGAASVGLSAGGATALAPAESPPGAIEIAVLPVDPVKRRDAEIRLELSMPAAPGEAPGAPPEVVASSGRVRDPMPAGPGRFTAIYEPEPSRYPEVAVILALAPRCPLCPTPRAVGYAIVPLAAAIDLPGQSEPGTSTRLTVGGRTFGPATADAAGRFTIPVVVPPGARFARAVSVDRIGNRREKEIDLRLPEVDRLACATWPRALPADGRSAASVWCVASAAAGEPAPGARLSLSASGGDVAPLVPFRGALQRARFRAPAGGGGRDAVLAAAYPEGGAASADEIRIALVTGAPATLSARLARDPVPLGATVAAETAARDANGDLLGRPSGPPGAALGFVAPDRFVARAAAGDLAQEAPLAFALSPGAGAATLSLRREGRGWIAVARTVDGRPAAGVPLRFGSGATATTNLRGEARVVAAGERETVAAPGGARAAGWAGIAPPPAPFELARTLTVLLRPPAPVEVVARVEAGVLRWRVEDGDGRALPGRAVSLRAGAVALASPERDGEGGRAAVRSGHGPVAVVDEATGVAAVVEVP